MGTHSPCCRHNPLRGWTGLDLGVGVARPNGQPMKGLKPMFRYSTHKYLLPDHLVELGTGGGGGT